MVILQVACFCTSITSRTKLGPKAWQIVLQSKFKGGKLMLKPSLSRTNMGWLKPDWLRYGKVSCFPEILVTTSSEEEKNLLASSSMNSLVPICRGLWVA